MTILRLAAVGATLVLAACSLERPLPEATTYSIEPTTAAAAPVTRRPETLRIGSVRVASVFDSRELVYRLDDVRFSTDFYNRFIAPPGPMLGTRMAVAKPLGAFPRRDPAGRSASDAIRARGSRDRSVRRFPTEP